MMNFKNCLFLIFFVLVLSGCGVKYKELPAKVIVNTEIVEKVVIKPCPVPDLSKVCDFSGDKFTPTEKLLNCVIEQKRVLDICSNPTDLNTTAE